MIRIFGLALVGLGIASTAAFAQSSYVGKWSTDGISCLLDQGVPGAPLLLQANRYDQHEAHCTFSSTKRTGPGSWKIRARCMVEGDRQRQDFTFALSGDTLTIRDRAGTRTYIRCW